MKKRFEFYWPVINLAGIILVLWSLTIINVNPDHDLKVEALLDSTDKEDVYEAGFKENRFFNQRNQQENHNPLVKKNIKLVSNF